MRGWMRPLILSALILGAAPFTAGSALAQGTGNPNAGSQNGGKPAAGKEAPKECPVCKHDQGYFIRLTLAPFIE